MELFLDVLSETLVDTAMMLPFLRFVSSMRLPVKLRAMLRKRSLRLQYTRADLHR